MVQSLFQNFFYAAHIQFFPTILNIFKKYLKGMLWIFLNCFSQKIVTEDFFKALIKLSFFLFFTGYNDYTEICLQSICIDFHNDLHIFKIQLAKKDTPAYNISPM